MTPAIRQNMLMALSYAQLMVWFEQKTYGKCARR
jgi:hypothetical protein